MIVSGKPELDKSDWLRTVHMKDAPKIKRACSNIVNLATLNEAVGIIYTSTAITISKVFLYRITATVGTTGAIDVGINADDECVVNAMAVAAAAIDLLLECTIASGAVAAGKMVTASVETAVGTSGTAVRICARAAGSGHAAAGSAESVCFGRLRED